MSTFLSVISGTVLFIFAIIPQGAFLIFLNPAALMILLGETLATIFISFFLPRELKVVQSLLQIFRKDIEKPLWAIAVILWLAVKAKQN